MVTKQCNYTCYLIHLYFYMRRKPVRNYPVSGFTRIAPRRSNHHWCIRVRFHHVPVHRNKIFRNNLRKFQIRVKLVLRTDFQNLCVQVTFSSVSEWWNIEKKIGLFSFNLWKPLHSLTNWCPFLWRFPSIDWNCFNFEVLCSFPFFLKWQGIQCTEMGCVLSLKFDWFFRSLNQYMLYHLFGIRDIHACNWLYR